MITDAAAGMPNMQQMLKQVQKMQADMVAAQEALKTEVVEASAGGGQPCRRRCSVIVADYQTMDRPARPARCFEFTQPGGALTCSLKVPWGSGSEFVAEAIRNNLLIIPGGTFSRQDSHFRISYAAEDRTIDQELEILNRIARRG